MTAQPDMLSIADVARRLNVSPRTARRFFSDVGGPLHRHGSEYTSRVLTSRVAFEAWCSGTAVVTIDRRSA